METRLDQLKQQLLEWHEANTETYVQAAKEIWSTPELSLEEVQSSGTLVKLLEDNGFSVEKGVAGMPTAFLAVYGSGSPVIGINAEYDALPGLSQNERALKKEPIVAGGSGHGCGHNLLGAAAVKAAIGLRKMMEQFDLPGTVKVIGAPAEELCLGKVFLGKEGYLNGFDAILDWHPWSYNRADYDSCCAYFSVKYHFKGKTSHGNSPWYGRSALDAAILQSHAVEMMREHISPGNPPDAANTINFTFTDTGPAFPSVVPDTTTAWYIGRLTTTAEAKNVLERISRCAEGAALSTETQVERELITATHHKLPNQVLAEVMHNNFQLVGPPVFTEEERERARAIQEEMGVAPTDLAKEILPFDGGYSVVCDTSEYSWNAPYATAWIAMAPPNIGWHHWGVTRCAADTMGERSLDTAAKVICLSALDLLCQPQLVEKAKAEFIERLGGETYQCLLSEEGEGR